jgi:hypothetical protein
MISRGFRLKIRIIKTINKFLCCFAIMGRREIEIFEEFVEIEKSIDDK